MSCTDQCTCILQNQACINVAASCSAMCPDRPWLVFKTRPVFVLLFISRCSRFVNFLINIQLRRYNTTHLSKDWEENGHVKYHKLIICIYTQCAYKPETLGTLQHCWIMDSAVMIQYTNMTDRQTDRLTYTSDRYATCVCSFGLDLCHSRQCPGKDQRRVGSTADTRESNAWQVHLASSHYWVRPAVRWHWQEAGSK